MSRSLEAAGELLLRAGRDAEKTIGNSITVLARVVSAPIPLSTKDVNVLYGRPPTRTEQRAVEARSQLGISGNESKSIFMFRGRIEDGDWEQNPHRFIPDPCEMSRADAASLAKIQKTIELCTKFTSEENYAGKTPKVGDWVNVRINKIRQPGSNAGSWDTANGDFVGMAIDSRAVSEAAGECRALVNLFQGDATPLGPPSPPAGARRAVNDENFPRRRAPDPDAIAPYGHNHYRAQTDPWQGIEVHYPVTPTLQSAIDALLDNNLSYHYLVDYDGTAVMLVNPSHIAHHGGCGSAPSPPCEGTNFQNIGISLISVGHDTGGAGASLGRAVRPPGITYDNWTLEFWGNKWQPYPESQITGLIALVNQLKIKYPSIERISGHEDNPHKTKSDPGPEFTKYWDRVVRETGLRHRGGQRGDWAPTRNYDSIPRS
jgi:N-acetylmuramoyl-L-alanine amidase